MRSRPNSAHFLGTRADLRIEIVNDLQRWGLLFCNYATYADLFGRPQGGMVPIEVTEAHLAWDEWDRYKKAREAWDHEHKADEDADFDTEAYIMDRIFCIESELDRIPLEPL